MRESIKQQLVLIQQLCGIQESFLDLGAEVSLEEIADFADSHKAKSVPMAEAPVVQPTLVEIPVVEGPMKAEEPKSLPTTNDRKAPKAKGKKAKSQRKGAGIPQLKWDKLDVNTLMKNGSLTITIGELRSILDGQGVSPTASKMELFNRLRSQLHNRAGELGYQATCVCKAPYTQLECVWVKLPTPVVE